MVSSERDGVEDALNLAQFELARGAFEAAARRILSLETSCGGRSLRRAAELLIGARRDEDATRLAVRVVAEQSDAWSWIRQFAGHMRAKGNLPASRDALGAFVAHASNAGERIQAELSLALGLPAAYRSTVHLNEVRQDFTQRLRRFIDAHAPDDLRASGVAADDLTWSNFFLAYQGGDDVALQTDYGRWLCASIAALSPQIEVPRARSANSLRIAIVSNRLHECTVGWYFASWIEHLASTGWTVVLIHPAGSRHDVLTARLSQIASESVVLPPSLADSARSIAAIAADIVLYPELGMDGFLLALAATRLAPTQLCAWGHPVTTGLPTMDAFLSCDRMEPPDANAHYSETLVRLPGIGTKYTSPQLPAAVPARALGLPDDRPLYLVPQVLYKLHPDSDRVLMEILRRDPRALFVLFELRSPSPALVVRDRLLRALADVSSDPASHLFWIPECSRADYLRINQVSSVMVDTPHWSAGNATLDALHCGLPIVTCPGMFMRGRQSAAMLQLLDCDELITADIGALADTAVAVANDRNRRDRIAERILRRLPAMTQSDAPLLALDAALRGMITAVR